MAKHALPICTLHWTLSAKGLCANLWGPESFLRLVFSSLVAPYIACVPYSCNYVYPYVIQAKVIVLYLFLTLQTVSYELHS